MRAGYINPEAICGVNSNPLDTPPQQQQREQRVGGSDGVRGRKDQKEGLQEDGQGVIIRESEGSGQRQVPSQGRS